MSGQKKLDKILPLPVALLWIVSSTLVISGSFHFVLKNGPIAAGKEKKVVIDTITSMIQTGPQKEALRSEYLAELIGLSVDRPKKTSQFSVINAEKALLASPVIQHAKVKVIKPSTVYINYTVRQPIARLYDFDNTALDKEGVPLPIYPFFPPKHLPELYLGINAPFSWNVPIGSHRLSFAFDVLKRLNFVDKDSFRVKRIDVSKLEENSLGRREIVVVLENMQSTEPGLDPVFSLHYLRLSPKNYAQELGNYLQLRENLLSKELQSLKQRQEAKALQTIIDLRLTRLAYIENDS